MSEQDTREKLEADLRDELRLVFGGNGGQRYASYKFVQSLLDRQDAITQREFAKAQEESTLEVMRANAKLRKEVEELTAERDTLQGALDIAVQNESKLEAERDELQAAIDAMENGQFYAMYEELRAEVDNLRKRNDNQADTIKRLRAEFDVALDDLARAVEDKRSHPF